MPIERIRISPVAERHEQEGLFLFVGLSVQQKYRKLKSDSVIQHLMMACFEGVLYMMLILIYSHGPSTSATVQSTH